MGTIDIILTVITFVICVSGGCIAIKSIIDTRNLVRTANNAKRNLKMGCIKSFVYLDEYKMYSKSSKINEVLTEYE